MNILEIIIGIVFTWIIGLLPAYLIRYKLFKKPLQKRWAVPLAFIIWSIQLVFTAYVTELRGAVEGSYTALNLVALVSFYILIKKDKNPQNESQQ